MYSLSEFLLIYLRQLLMCGTRPYFVLGDETLLEHLNKHAMLIISSAYLA